MRYWRMQLHPDDASNAMRHTVHSLASGFIGLDFADDPGDLTLADYGSLPETHKDYVDFATKMRKGDKVLVIVHHFPFALATIDGKYNYIKAQDPNIDVWFRHFRRVKDVKYYADRVKNAHKWDKLIMTDTISALRHRRSLSYKLIESWK